MKVEAFYRKRKQLSQYLPPSERHKLKVERPRPSNSALNSPARSAVDRPAVGTPANVTGAPANTDSSLVDSPGTQTGGQGGSGGKRRPSDPDSEADMGLSGDSSRMTGLSEVTNGENQPPLKRSNTANENPVNGNGLEVS